MHEGKKESLTDPQHEKSVVKRHIRSVDHTTGDMKCSSQGNPGKNPDGFHPGKNPDRFVIRVITRTNLEILASDWLKLVFCDKSELLN